MSAAPNDQAKQDSPLANLIGSTRALLFAQLLFAAIAVAAGVWAANVVPDAIARREQLGREITALEGEITNRQREIEEFERRQAELAQGLPLMVSGMRALAQGDVPEALSFLGQANEHIPGDSFVLSNLSLALGQHGDYAGALETVNAAIAADPGQPSNYLNRAGFLCALQRNADATQSLRQAPESVLNALAADPEALRSGAALVRLCGPEMAAIRAALGVSEGTQDGTTAAAADFRFTRLFFHISNESQRPAALALQRVMEAQGYRVAGIQLVSTPYRSSVRYYYDVQQPQAEQVAQALLAAAADAQMALGPDRLLLIPLQDRYPNLPRDRAEVWF